MSRTAAQSAITFSILLTLGLWMGATADPAETKADRPAMTLSATQDFPDIKAGQAPYYVDKPRNALAINACNVSFRDKRAKATTAFAEAGGTYDIAITTVGEFDGESTYRLYINDQLVGKYQNKPVDETGNMKPQVHTWPGVAVKHGDTIGVESNPHTNGKIPEGDGTAWSRGRWLQLDFRPAE